MNKKRIETIPLCPPFSLEITSDQHERGLYNCDLLVDGHLNSTRQVKASDMDAFIWESTELSYGNWRAVLPQEQWFEMH